MTTLHIISKNGDNLGQSETLCKIIGWKDRNTPNKYNTNNKRVFFAVLPTDPYHSTNCPDCKRISNAIRLRSSGKSNHVNRL